MSRETKDTILNREQEHKGANSDFITVEAYKQARTNIVLSVIKSGCKRLVFSSSLAREGKTTTCCNIAAALSLQVNCRVLLIDCDLRKPAIARFFHLKNSPGLTHYLSGMCSIEEIIRKVPETNLSVICSGQIPPNPSELLSCSVFDEMVERLSSEYDYIVFDVPPINVVSDALPLIKKSDGVVLVAYEGRSTVIEMDKTIATLKRIDANILGFILNGSQCRGFENKRYKKEYDYYSG